jgi:hypothetical protein
MFQKATRKKIRFESPQGLLSIEDLWDLPMTSAKGSNLDDIARNLWKQLKDCENTIFVAKKPLADDITQLKFDLVKHVIDVRIAEAQLAADIRANKEKKQRLLALIETKEYEQLAGSSVEELRKMAADL